VADVKSTHTRGQGQDAEDFALRYLRQQGLDLVARNHRMPGRAGYEIDLIMKTGDGTLVFIEVRQRHNTLFGGAAATVSWHKQRRIIRAATHFLLRVQRLPPIRFDVVDVQGSRVQWLQGAFDESV
jgi:putative endonuclease